MSQLTQKELNLLCQTSCEIARLAGKKLIKFQKQLNSLKVSAKEAQGVVSRADIETEQFIIKKLHQNYPSFGVLGEESSFSVLKSMAQFKKFAHQTEYCWIIDPLDGTTNFLTGLDYFAVCIGLYHQGEMLFGVVHRPQRDESYFAIKGKGAWKTIGDRPRTRLHGPSKKRLIDSVLATGFSSEKGRLINQEFRIFKQMMNSCRGIRRMGSAALDMALLAEGSFNGFWERGLAPWDIAAAGIICQEAGVVLSDWQGREFTPFIATIMGAQSGVVKEIYPILAGN